MCVHLAIEIGKCIESGPKQLVKHPFVLDLRRTEDNRGAVVRRVYLSVVVNKLVQELEDTPVFMGAFHSVHNEALDVTLCYGSLCGHTWKAAALQVKKIFFNNRVIGF